MVLEFLFENNFTYKILHLSDKYFTQSNYFHIIKIEKYVN